MRVHPERYILTIFYRCVGSTLTLVRQIPSPLLPSSPLLTPEGSGGTTLLLYFAFALMHDSRGIEIVNFTTAAALSAGMLMASAGTPYRLVPAHFYPCLLQATTQV